MDITTTGVFNDPHIPFHDPLSYALVLDVLEDLKIDRLIINGDFVDFYNVNSHVKNKHPEVYQTIEDEIESCVDHLNEIDKRFPNTEKVFLAGNHENRLERYVIEKCAGLFNYLDFKNLMNFKGRGWEYYPYQEVYRLEKTHLYVVHSPPSYSQNVARTSLLKRPDSSFIYGCCHRIDYACTTGVYEVYEVFANGWLGSTKYSEEHKKVFSYTKNNENWQQCFSLVYIISNKIYNVDQIRVHAKGDKRWCFVHGNYYEV